MGPFDNSAARHRRRYNTSASGISARVRRAAEKGGFGIHSDPVYPSLSRLFFQPSSTPCDLTNTRLLRAPRTTLRNIWWHFFGYRGLRRNPSSTHSIVPTASRSFILSLFLSCARAFPRTHMHTTTHFTRDSCNVFLHPHTVAPSVYRVSIPESTHEDDRERHRAPLFPSTFLSLSLSPFLYIPYRPLPLSFFRSHLSRRTERRCLLCGVQENARRIASRGTHRAKRRYTYIRLGRVSVRACVPPAVGSRDRSATVVPPPFRPPSANGRR